MVHVGLQSKATGVTTDPAEVFSEFANANYVGRKI